MTSTLPSPSAGEQAIRDAFHPMELSAWTEEHVRTYPRKAAAIINAALASLRTDAPSEDVEQEKCRVNDLLGREAAALTSASKQEGGEPSDAQIEAAAKVIAACMDYPWDPMPEQGRANMRKHAVAVAVALAGFDGDLMRGVDELVCEAYAHWDADREMKVGKILLALIGHNKGYDKRADAWRAAIGGA